MSADESTPTAPRHVISVPRVVVSPGPGVKYDHGKPRYDLLPPRALLEFVLVLTFGAKKYTANGWKAVVGWRWRYARAALTHVFRYLAGEARDPETGLHHLAHALCCIIFMLDNELALEAGVKTVPDGDTEAVEQPKAPPTHWVHWCKGAQGNKVTMSVEYADCVCGEKRDDVLKEKTT